MESIYLPRLDRSSETLEIPKDEARHLRALRLREGSRLYAVNGRGLAAEIEIESIGKDVETKARAIQFIENMGEPSGRRAIAFGILADREKNELIVEKAVELGFSDIIPVIANRSQKKEVNVSRLQLKSIAAMKQCLRSVLPVIHAPVKLVDALASENSYDYRVLADIEGEKPSPLGEGSAIVYIGPEGGFDEGEIELVKRQENVEVWSLGQSRLRAETASIVIMGLLAAL